MRIQQRFGFWGFNPPSAIRHPLARRAFTLIELLVVIAIISLLAGITLLFLPKREVRLAAQGADQLQTFLASARSRALRDQAPRGVRLVCQPQDMVVDGSGNTVPSRFRSALLLETPEPVAPVDPSILNNLPGYPVPNSYTIFLTLNPGSASVVQNNFPLQGIVNAGDFLEITTSGSGSVHRIVDIRADGVTLDLATVPPMVNSSTNKVYLPSNYRYIRQPRPLMGEQPLQLPNTVYVKPIQDPNPPPGFPPPYSLNLPTSYPDLNGNYNYDIIFSPSGQVINATAGRIVLSITDDNNVSAPTLLTIYARTGAVASHPVAPGANPYFFTQAGRSSGQ